MEIEARPSELVCRVTQSPQFVAATRLPRFLLKLTDPGSCRAKWHGTFWAQAITGHEVEFGVTLAESSDGEYALFTMLFADGFDPRIFPRGLPQPADPTRPAFRGFGPIDLLENGDFLYLEIEPAS